MTKGFIYCISNPSFKENLYKIGFTTKALQTRIDSLYKTGVPTQFHINFAKMVKDCRRTENEIHIRLKRSRVNPSREFFKCTLPKIKGIFDKIQGTWWGEDSKMVTKKIDPVHMSILKKNFNLRSGISQVKSSKRPTKRNSLKKTVRRIKLFRKVKQTSVNYKV